MKIKRNIAELIGHTPLLDITDIFDKNKKTLLFWLNSSASTLQEAPKTVRHYP